MKYEEYRGRKEGKKPKNPPTADMRNPVQAEGLEEKHSRAKGGMGRGVKEMKIATPDEADETAEE